MAADDAQGGKNTQRRDMLLALQEKAQTSWTQERIFEVDAPAPGTQFPDVPGGSVLLPSTMLINISLYFLFPVDGISRSRRFGNNLNNLLIKPFSYFFSRFPLSCP